MLQSKSKKVHCLDFLSFFLYLESNNLFIYSNLGISKYKLPICLNFYIEKLFFQYNNLFFRKRKYLNEIFQFFNRINKLFLSIIYGYTLKYKIIGLGHRAYYSKNIYLFKIGYSHLVFTFIPICIRGLKKKKKKPFYKLSSINEVFLNNFFFFLQNLRIPDIYSKNGIFNRTDLYSFKKGKKSFLL